MSELLIDVSDPVADLRGELLSHPIIANLSQGRIFGGELPEAEDQFMPRQCIIISPAGGFDAASYVETTRMRFDFRTYGETYQQAWALRQIVNQYLKQIRRLVANRTLFHWFNLVSGPMQLREQDYKWPLVFDTYLSLVAEVPAP